MNISRSLLLLSVVLLMTPDSKSSAQAKAAPTNPIDQYVEAILLQPAQRGHFLSEEQMKKLSPEARAEIADLLLGEKIVHKFNEIESPIGVSLDEWVQREKQYHYMIGVVVVPDDEVESDGVVIQRVTEDSPALKSGLKDGDTILKVDETEVSDLDSLMDAIEASGGKELTLLIRRKADANIEESVKVTPVERPQETPVNSEEVQVLENWINSVTKRHDGVSGYHAIHPQLQMLTCQKCHSGVSRIQTVYPGVVVDRPATPLPDNLSISITRQGAQPARITVKREEHTWELNENELEKLPADIRSHVEHMLGRVNQPHVYSVPGVRRIPSTIYRLPESKPAEPPKVEYKPVPRVEYRKEVITKSQQHSEEQFSQQLKQLQQQLEALQKSVDQLQKDK